MKGRKVTSTVLVVAVVSLLVVLGLKVRVAATADSVAVLKTTGMSCSSCSSKITEGLAGAKGIASAEVDVTGGWVIVGYDSKLIKPEAIADKVSSIGFGSRLYDVLSPEKFRQLTGRNVGQTGSGGCCGKNGRCDKK